MKRVTITIASCLFAIILYAQSYNEDAQIKQHLDAAESYFNYAVSTGNVSQVQNHYKAAIKEYKNTLKLLLNRSSKDTAAISVIYYQLCICYAGISKYGQAESYLKKYEQANPFNNNEIADLKYAIRYKQGTTDKVNWNNREIEKHNKFVGFEYSNAYAGFKSGSQTYHACLQGISIESGSGINDLNSFAFAIDLGIYYIPYGYSDKSLWNFDTWSYRLGIGPRYIQHYPLFNIGGLCFRYTGYAGLAIEGMTNGGYMYGDEDTGFFNAVGYKLSSGLFISTKTIPRGLRVEAIYQGHWYFAKNPPEKCLSYFGIQVGLYLGF